MLRTHSMKIPLFQMGIFYVRLSVAPLLTIGRPKVGEVLHKLVEYLVRRVWSHHKDRFNQGGRIAIPENKAIRINLATG